MSKKKKKYKVFWLIISGKNEHSGVMAISPALQGMFQLKPLNGTLKNKDNVSCLYFVLN